MSKKLNIQKLETRTVNTKYGEKEQWVVNDKWSSFKGGWNADWKEGDEILGEFVEKEINGKTYYNINCPPEYKTSAYGQSGDSSALMQKLDGIEKLLKKCLEQKGMTVEEIEKLMNS